MSKTKDRVVIPLEHGFRAFFPLGDVYGAFWLCVDGVRKYVSLPAGCSKLDLVLTKKPRADSFKLKASGDVWGVRESLFSDTQRAFAKQYRAGRKYFHFEY